MSRDSYYPESVKKQFTDAGFSVIEQDDLATDGDGGAAQTNAIATALNQVLGVLEALGLRVEEPAE